MRVAIERQDDGALLAIRSRGLATLRGVPASRLNRMRVVQASQGLCTAIEAGAPLPIVVKLIAGEAHPAAPAAAPVSNIGAVH